MYQLVARLPALALIALSCVVQPATAQAEEPARHSITHEDVWLMKRLGAVAVSPDGRWIVTAVSEPAYDDDKKRSDLWIVPADGSAPPRQLTSSKGGEGDPVFSPDSRRLAFTAKREGDEFPQVYMRDLAGGEAVRATEWPTGARAPAFSPDGRTILFTAMAYPGAATLDDNRKAAADRKARKYSARTYDIFPVRHWDRWLDELQPTLVIQPIEPAGEPRDLLAGSALRGELGYGGRLGNDGESLDAAWTPDGEGIVFCATTNRHEAARAEVILSLWHVGLDGSAPRRLTGDEGDYASPRFTRDGASLLAKVQPNSKKWVYVADRLVRWSWPAFTERRLLTDDLDRSVGAFAIAPDDRHAYFLAGEAGHDKLFQVPLSGGQPTEIGSLVSGTYSRLAVGGSADAPVLASAWSSAVHPHEVGRIDPATGQWTSLSAFNAERAAAIDWQPVEEFWFTSRRGRRVHNIVVRPPGFDASKKYPLLVLIHGGPHGMWTDDFIFRWNYHLLGAPGYVVLLTNYSGSTGFGEAFARGIQFDPLEGPANEINQAADVAIKRYPWIDGSRHAVGGGSYGGHLTNWLAVTTDRYRAFVSHAGLYDLKTQWTTSDSVYSRERNVGGPAWKSLPLWRDQSPFYRSEKLRGPILLTGGEKDYRVPVNNLLEFWTVLQRQDVPSRLVIFPDENHWVLKGENSRYFYQEVHGWLAKYL